ncbi:MAG TPA: hypothetical protein VFH89_00285 [Sphingomicrobium sp.]|nr:hypothetical protein [Sphingomicrobium sp.]
MRWWLVASLVALAGLGALWTAESRCQTQQNVYRAQTAKEDGRSKVSQLAIDRSWMPCLVERATADPQVREADQYEQRDLIAQETTAGIAFWVALIAFFQLIATVIGLSFIKRTLDATWKAVDDTSKATKAIERQNEITEDTAKRQLRAYVTTEDHDIVGFFRGGPTTLRTKIYNRGQTPAYDVMIWSIVCGTLDDPDTYKVKQRKKEDFKQSRSMLGPGQWILHENACQAPLDGDAYVGIVAGKLKLIFAGVVTYRDAFGKRHFTIFRQFYTGEGNWAVTKADLLACGRGNTGT